MPYVRYGTAVLPGLELDGCPTATNIVPQADGGLARVHLLGGRLALEQVEQLAELSERYGSGVLELTNRGNVQLRGIRLGEEGAVRHALLGTGRADDQWAGGVVVTALAGLDAGVSADAWPLASDIAHALRTISHAGLSAKFAVHVDGGGEAGLADRPFDISIGLDHSAETRCWLTLGSALAKPRAGATFELQIDDAVPSVLDLVRWCADVARTRGEPVRMRQALDVAGVATAAELMAAQGGSADSGSTRSQAAIGPVGVHAQVGADAVYLAASAPLGRLQAMQLRELAALAADFGDGSLRITPWQSVIVPAVPPSDADAVVRQLEALGLMCDPAHPACHVIACSGSTGCAAGRTDAQADASHIIGQLGPLSSDDVVHVSGCEKRCARREPATVTLIGTRDGYDAFDREEARAAQRGLGRDAATALVRDELRAPQGASA